jgi:Putative sensor
VDAATPLPARPGRLRLVASSAPWRSAAYLLSSIVTGTVLFALVVVAIAVAAPLVVVGIGVPLLLGAAVLVRGAAHVERQLAALAPDVEVANLPADDSDRTDRTDRTDRAGVDSGLIAAVRSRWSDPAMGPALGYLVALFVPLVVFDAVVAGVWLALLSGVTIPFWYWAVPETFDGTTAHGLFWGWFPHGPDGPGAIGLAIDDLPTALAVAGVMAVLFVVAACPLVVAAARLHARIAGRLLGPPIDPLAPAKAVLRSPGPLALADSGHRGYRGHLAAVPPVR